MKIIISLYLLSVAAIAVVGLGVEPHAAPPPLHLATNGKAKRIHTVGKQRRPALPFVQKDQLSNYPATYYDYIPLGDAYNSNFFYKIESLVPEANRSTAPLVMWLQGGPGASSLLGAYMENGAVNFELDPSNTNGYTFVQNTFAWGKYATMLYVDNPIGTGFSYSDNINGLSTTDDQIATNLVAFLHKFLASHPEYVSNDFWIFSESYGGKMASYFGAALAKAVLVDKSFPEGFKFAGAALGDGWVDPIGCMQSYGPYLQALGQVTAAQAVNVNQFATDAATALAAGNGIEATNQWNNQQTYISNVSNNLNWYNVLTTFSYHPDDQLSTWLQDVFPLLPEVTQFVDIKTNFSAQSDEVFTQLSGAFMHDGISQVEYMLNLGVQVAVYVGEVDLIVDPICVKGWVNKMNNWNGLPEFQTQGTQAFSSTQFAYPLQVLATKQSYENFQLWTVSTAGHMVPADSPLGAEIMFTSIIGAPLSAEAILPIEELQRRDLVKVASASAINPEKRFLP